MTLHCPKCLCGRTGDVLGAPCLTSGCTGIISEQPEFKTLVDELPEPMTCGRRAESGMDRDDSPFTGVFRSGTNLDRWQKFKSNGNRVCSYCGSLHPDDLFDLVRQSAGAPQDVEYSSVVEIEPSDKSYKIYVHQPGVRNAHEGGIKFYTPHLPRNSDGSSAVTDEQNTEYSRAVHASRKRFNRMLAMQRKPASETAQ